MLSHWELLWTRAGREWLEEWCGLTRLEGDAARWLKELSLARAKVPDGELSD